MAQKTKAANCKDANHLGQRWVFAMAGVATTYADDLSNYSSVSELDVLEDVLIFLAVHGQGDPLAQLIGVHRIPALRNQGL